MNPLILPLFIFAINELAAMSAEQEDRDEKYEFARGYADYVGKPLLVVGGPYGTAGFRRALNLPAHPFGDVCIDIDPAACDGDVPYVEADVRDIPFPDKYFGAAYCSHTLEHLPTAQDAIDAVNELNRVAEAVFVAYPTPESMIAFLLTDHYLWFTQEGNVLYVQQR